MSSGFSIFEIVTPMTTIYIVAVSAEETPTAIFQTREEAERFIQNQ
jgi:hypothetical protein